jgi:hypothetical protein
MGFERPLWKNVTAVSIGSEDASRMLRLSERLSRPDAAVLLDLAGLKMIRFMPEGDRPFGTRTSPGTIVFSAIEQTG